MDLEDDNITLIIIFIILLLFLQRRRYQHPRPGVRPSGRRILGGVFRVFRLDAIGTLTTPQPHPEGTELHLYNTSCTCAKYTGPNKSSKVDAKPFVSSCENDPRPFIVEGSYCRHSTSRYLGSSCLAPTMWQ